MANRVLVVTSHPDDAELMAGGTIAKHVMSGDTVHILVIADGETSRDGEHNVQGRQGMMRAACKVLGVHQAEALDFQDQQLDTVPRLAIIKEIEKRITEFKPSIVYTHWDCDLNLDHRIVNDATMVACRPQPGCSVKTILLGEIVSSSEWAGGFWPTCFCDISNLWHKKQAALDCYKSEMRSYPHPRSRGGLLALAEYRGSSIGVELAEGFELRRMVV